MTEFQGAWFARPLNRGKGYNRRPHFYVVGNSMSLCGNSHHQDNDLGFDPETSLTTEADPLIGEPQYRRPCGTCQFLLDNFIPYTQDDLDGLAREEDGVASLQRIYFRQMHIPADRVLDQNDPAQLIQAIWEWQGRRGMNRGQ